MFFFKFSHRRIYNYGVRTGLWLIMAVGCEKLKSVIFLEIAMNYVGNGEKYDQSYCYSVIESRIRPFDWYHNE